MVASANVGGLFGSVMDAGPRSGFGQIEADADIAERRNSELHGVTKYRGIRRDGDKRSTAEGKRVIGTGRYRRIVIAQGDVGGLNGDRFVTVRIGEADAYATTAHAGVNDFAERLIVEE